jgi:hypothetical protein
VFIEKSEEDEVMHQYFVESQTTQKAIREENIVEAK